MESVLAVYMAVHGILNPYSRGSSTADVDFPSIFSFLLVRLFRYVLRLPRISHRVWQYLSVLFFFQACTAYELLAAARCHIIVHYNRFSRRLLLRNENGPTTL